jgi:hypothetical protein
MRLRLLTGLAGILYPLLTLQTILRILPHPELPAEPTADQARAFLVENYWVLQAQTWFHIMGILCFGVFLVGLTTILRERTGAADPWLRVATFSGAGMVAVKVAAMAMLSGLFTVHERLDALLVLAINDALWYTQSMMIYFGPFLFGALAVVILKTRALPTWTGWTATALAVLSFSASLLILSPSLGFATFPVMVLTLLWSLLVGIYFLATSRTPSPIASTQLSQTP